MRSIHADSPATLGRPRVHIDTPTYIAMHEANLCMEASLSKPTPATPRLYSREPLPVSPGASRRAGRVSCSAARRRARTAVHPRGQPGRCGRAARAQQSPTRRNAGRAPAHTQTCTSRSRGQPGSRVGAGRAPASSSAAACGSASVLMHAHWRPLANVMSAQLRCAPSVTLPCGQTEWLDSPFHAPLPEKTGVRQIHSHTGWDCYARCAPAGSAGAPP